MESALKFQLTDLQKIILNTLKSSPLKKRFYWTGGTALAFFHLSHRRSNDIDLFCDEEFSYHDISAFLKMLKKAAQLKEIEQKHIFDRWEFFLHNHGEMRLEFVRYPFPPLHRRKKWNGIFVDSFQDMATNKTMALLDRHEPKDVFDIYVMLRRRLITPTKLIILVKKKFGVAISLSTFWSTALQRAQQLQNIEPLLYGTKRENENFLNDIQLYFRKNSAQFLAHKLEATDREKD